MSDKKVERNVRSSDTERPITPTQKMEAARSNEGMTVPDSVHDKGKSALLDRFREREERYRREQALHAQEEAALPEGPAPAPESPDSDSPPSAATEAE